MRCLMAEVKLIIDGIEVRVNEGATVLQAAQNVGVEGMVNLIK